MIYALYSSDCEEEFIFEAEFVKRMQIFWCDDCNSRHVFEVEDTFETLEELWAYLS